MTGVFPRPRGRSFTKALEEIAGRLGPRDEEGTTREQRHADALVELARGQAGTSNKPLLVVHTSVDSLSEGAEVEGSGAVHPEVVKRISCDARLQAVLHDSAGVTVGIGNVSRTIPDWLRREVIRRDRGCVFCGTMRYVECHHVVPWPEGPTDLDNLVLLCNFHHELVHEGGWRVELDAAQLPVWFRPDGTCYQRARPVEDAPRSRPAALALIAAGFG